MNRRGPDVEPTARSAAKRGSRILEPGATLELSFASVCAVRVASAAAFLLRL